MARPKKKFTEREKALILALYEEGKTDAQVAKVVGMPRNTFTDACKYNSLTVTIKKAKEPSNKKVESALYKRALGYEYDEDHVEVKTHKISGTKKEGKNKKEEKFETPEMITEKKQKKIKKHMAADVGAGNIWLCNRDPQRWKHIMSLQIAGPEGKPIPLTMKIERVERIKLPGEKKKE